MIAYNFLSTTKIDSHPRWKIIKYSHRCLILNEARSKSKNKVVNKITWGHSIAAMDLLGVKNDVKHTYKNLAPAWPEFVRSKKVLFLLPTDEMVLLPSYSMRRHQWLYWSEVRYRARKGPKRMLFINSARVPKIANLCTLQNFERITWSWVSL